MPRPRRPGRNVWASQSKSASQPKLRSAQKANFLRSGVKAGWWLSAAPPAPTQDDEGVFLGIPNPPSNAASGCFEADFCGAAEAEADSSTLRTDDGDGS
jgi:hypothetical protein